jgi:hypothetical protein
MEIVLMVQHLVVDMIFIFQINQIKITVHMQRLDIHIFIQIMFIIINKHGKNSMAQH